MFINSKFEFIILESLHVNEFDHGKAPLIGAHKILRTDRSSSELQNLHQAHREGEALSHATGIKFNTHRVGFRGEALTLHHAEIPNSGGHTLVVKKHDDGSHTYGVHGPSNQGHGFYGTQKSHDSLETIHHNVKKLFGAGEFVHGVSLKHDK